MEFNVGDEVAFDDFDFSMRVYRTKGTISSINDGYATIVIPNDYDIILPLEKIENIIHTSSTCEKCGNYIISKS